MTPEACGVARVVSGGQSGVDRGALVAARRAGVPVGGWCPDGGVAEDLPDPPGVLALFPDLRPAPSADPEVRTRWNVRDSDATLVLMPEGVESPGTDLTVALAAELGRPHLVVDVEDVTEVRAWLAGLPAGSTLNVAGPRESEAPGIGAEVERLLTALIDPGLADRS